MLNDVNYDMGSHHRDEDRELQITSTHHVTNLFKCHCSLQVHDRRVTKCMVHAPVCPTQSTLLECHISQKTTEHKGNDEPHLYQYIYHH